ncbi:Uncharacterized protein dnm_072660 [Desulfonema magnum]|uniref:Uncharacterized protein n=1 Tax=Desulfonema magnum TaxID=45655 RepID=A0A975BT43_9BACT|nr:Uncharacterized protein dnm_072660 [Desulfonema magnum]
MSGIGQMLFRQRQQMFSRPGSFSLTLKAISSKLMKIKTLSIFIRH